MGAYCRPRCTHCGSAQSDSEMKNSERETTDTPASSTMVNTVQGSV